MAEKTTSRWKSHIGLLLGLLFLGGEIAFAVARGDRRNYLALLERARPLWLLVALLLQAGTYFCAANVWTPVLRMMRSPVSLVERIPFAIAKLSFDQLVPTTGVGGTLLVVRALTRSGVKKRVAVAAVIVDLLSFYIAHAIAVIVALVILSLHRDLNAPVMIAAALFGVVAVAVPCLVLVVHRKGERGLPSWLMKIPGLGGILRSLGEAASEPVGSAAVLARATAWQMGVFLLDAATLGVMLMALGRPAEPDVVFATLTITTMVATLSILPGAIGMFEVGSVAALSLLGVPMETAVAATLLMRLFNFWLPMIPGLIITRRISRGHRRAPSHEG